MSSRMIPVVALALVSAPLLAGCIDLGETLGAQSVDLPDGSDVFDTSRGWSQPLSPALYDILDGVKEFVPSFDDTPISLGIFFPDVEGCDWEAESLPDACRLPVVMDAGPYYADHVDYDKYRPPIIEWLVPRGYVVVQMSIRGTGESAGCMEFMSLNEQKDVDAMVTWLAEQPWSNGNVGMMGRSYDGTTPFMAAAQGNPHLKTIVPISGVASVPHLMFKNGTSEFRGPIMHSAVYWAFYGVGVSDGGAFAHRADHWSEQACEELVMGQAEGTAGLATGDMSSEYWQVRDFRPRILESYKGSVWIIHGLEDWNVNPSQVVPWINDLQDAGIPTRAWLGVWGHAYPDRVDEHRNVRWDWAEETVKWFDYWLKGEGAEPTLNVEVEDSLFVWRAEESYPPRDAVMHTFELGPDGNLVHVDAGEGQPGEGSLVLAGGPPEWALEGFFGSVAAVGDLFSFTSEPLAEELRIAGLPQLHLTATPSTPAGDHLFAELYDVFPDGRSVRIGWAAINLRYADGGNTEMQTLVPGQPVLAQMEFEPVDALVAKGHRIRVYVHKAGVEDILPSPTPTPVALTVGGGNSLLYLPVVDRPTIIPTYTPPTIGTSTEA